MYNNQNSIKTPATFTKTITLVHLALLMGQVLFGLAAFFITNKTVINLTPGSDVFFYIVPIMIVFGIFTGSFLFKQQVAKLSDKTLLTEKLTGYQTALIIRFALSNGTSMLGIVVYMQIGNLFYLIVTGVNILYFIWIRPTKDKIKDDLNLTYEDEIAMEG